MEDLDYEIEESRQQFEKDENELEELKERSEEMNDFVKR